MAYKESINYFYVDNYAEFKNEFYAITRDRKQADRLKLLFTTRDHKAFVGQFFIPSKRAFDYDIVICPYYVIQHIQDRSLFDINDNEYRITPLEEPIVDTKYFPRCDTYLCFAKVFHETEEAKQIVKNIDGFEEILIDHEIAKRYKD